MHSVHPHFQGVVFEPGTLTCQSLSQNIIAVPIAIALFQKVLQAASAHDANELAVKLANRSVPGLGTQDSVRPMLIFKWNGDNVELGQEMPVGKPCQDMELNRLKELCDVAQLCPFYLDIQPEMRRITVRIRMDDGCLKLSTGTSHFKKGKTARMR